MTSEYDDDDADHYLFSFLFSDGGKKTLAKMVDLDPEAQVFTEIWGWRIRIGNLFSADYTPVPCQYLWNKMTIKRGDFSLGSAYQSVLSNITWIDSGEGSPFIQQIQDAMKNGNIDNERLSIRFNVDVFKDDSRKGTFTIGRLAGKLSEFTHCPKSFPLLPYHRHRLFAHGHFFYFSFPHY